MYAPHEVTIINLHGGLPRPALLRGVMLQALVQNEDGKWRTGAVRNTSLFSDYPLVSSIYRMARLKTLEGSGLLDEVAEALVGKPARGASSRFRPDRIWRLYSGYA